MDSRSLLIKTNVPEYPRIRARVLLFESIADVVYATSVNDVVNLAKKIGNFSWLTSVWQAFPVALLWRAKQKKKREIKKKL